MGSLHFSWFLTIGRLYEDGMDKQNLPSPIWKNVSQFILFIISKTGRASLFCGTFVVSLFYSYVLLTSRGRPPHQHTSTEQLPAYQPCICLAIPQPPVHQTLHPQRFPLGDLWAPYPFFVSGNCEGFMNFSSFLKVLHSSIWKMSHHLLLFSFLKQ